MDKIAVLLTVFNRKDKTLSCLDSLNEIYKREGMPEIHVFITDDGCTDGTAEALEKREYNYSVHILKGTGNLYWNGGMINSWKAALAFDDFDGFLWLNDDTNVLPCFWTLLLETEKYAVNNYGKRGIYVGATCDPETKQFTYGGFNFTNKWTLKDRFIVPDNRTIQACQCAHGNITYISREVVDKMGIFYSKYVHGGGDHDYTYRAWKCGFPVLAMRSYVGLCKNDHQEDGYADFFLMPLKKRIAYLKSPFGFNLHNTLLFQKRCFPHRYIYVGLMGYMKAFFPSLYFKMYRKLR